MRNCYILGVFLASCAPAGPVARFEIEVPSPAIQQGRLTEPVGFETLDGVFTPVLMPCALPCERTEVFSTALDSQPQIALHVFRGSSQSVAEAHLLGRFAILGLPPQPRGVPQIDVTLRADMEGLVLSARDRGGECWLVSIVGSNLRLHGRDVGPGKSIGGRSLLEVDAVCARRRSSRSAAL